MCVGVDFYIVAVGEFPGQKLGGQGVFQSLLNCTFQGSCTEGGVVTFVHNLPAGVVGEFEGYVAAFEALGKVIELDIDNLSQVLFVEHVEDDYFIDAVQELGFKEQLECVFDVGFDFPVGA